MARFIEVPLTQAYIKMLVNPEHVVSIKEENKETTFVLSDGTRHHSSLSAAALADKLTIY